jgi:hypothetical protein
MKRIYSLILLAAMLWLPVMVSAKPTVVEKHAKEEAQKLKKDGWKVLPGELPMEEQLTGLYHTLLETDGDGKPRYINVQGYSNPCSTLAEAEKQAILFGRWEMIEVTEPSMEITRLVSPEKEPDGDAKITFSSSRTISSYGYVTEMDQVGDDSYIKYTCSQGVMIELTTENGITDGVYHWDVLREFCESIPVAKEAWCVAKFYRKTDRGYEVRVEMCNYSPQVKAKEDLRRELQSNPKQLNLDSLFFN